MSPAPSQSTLLALMKDGEPKFKMKNLIKLIQILKEKYFSSCLVTRKKAEEFPHEINGADMPLWDSKKETLHRIMVNLGTVLKEVQLSSHLFMPGLQAKSSCFNLLAVTQDRQKETG